MALARHAIRPLHALQTCAMQWRHRCEASVLHGEVRASYAPPPLMHSAARTSALWVGATVVCGLVLIPYVVRRR